MTGWFRRIVLAPAVIALTVTILTTILKASPKPFGSSALDF